MRPMIEGGCWQTLRLSPISKDTPTILDMHILVYSRNDWFAVGKRCHRQLECTPDLARTLEVPRRHYLVPT
jgi:hypothetical protein